METLMSIGDAISEALEYVGHRVLPHGGTCVVRHEHQNSRIVVEPNGRSFGYEAQRNDSGAELDRG